jgi:Ras-related protein Rab-8A
MENIVSNFKLSDGSLVTCNFYDTNGTERFRPVNEPYYKKVDGCLIVYDITNQKSFDEIEEYFIPNIQDKCKENIPVFILGNKSDLKDKRIISVEQGNQLALRYNYIFKEISSVKNSNLNDIFQRIIRMIKRYVDNRDNREHYENQNIQDLNNINNPQGGENYGRCPKCFCY